MDSRALSSSAMMANDDDDSGIVKRDPTGRYGRYNEVLGQGACKVVYKAFDEEEGIEVAWNEVKMQSVMVSSGERDAMAEVQLLMTLHHKNIIRLYASWIDMQTNMVIFITEIFTSGTLRQYRKKHKHVDMKAVKNWSRQILRGLLYLHSHNPPIIHRDLKCDNIFVNGNQGEVKIGDLGLAAILSKTQTAHTVIGTPEFMAPELYDENYDEKVDIYAFGMCLLELITQEYPYSECENAGQIFRKVTSGKKPQALAKIEDPQVLAFIEKCLAPQAADRLSAAELLQDPFLSNIEPSKSMYSLTRPDSTAALPTSGTPYTSHSMIGSTAFPMAIGRHASQANLAPESSRQSVHQDASHPVPVSMPSAMDKSGFMTSEGSQLFATPYKKEGSSSGRGFRVKGKIGDEPRTLHLRLRIRDVDGHVRTIQFPFNIDTDTADAVASEMVEELALSKDDLQTIAREIEREVSELVPSWKPGAEEHAQLPSGLPPLPPSNLETQSSTNMSGFAPSADSSDFAQTSHQPDRTSSGESLGSASPSNIPGLTAEVNLESLAGSAAPPAVASGAAAAAATAAAAGISALPPPSVMASRGLPPQPPPKSNETSFFSAPVPAAQGPEKREPGSPSPPHSPQAAAESKARRNKIPRVPSSSVIEPVSPPKIESALAVADALESGTIASLSTLDIATSVSPGGISPEGASPGSPRLAAAANAAPADDVSEEEEETDDLEELAELDRLTQRQLEEMRELMRQHEQAAQAVRMRMLRKREQRLEQKAITISTPLDQLNVVNDLNYVPQPLHEDQLGVVRRTVSQAPPSLIRTRSGSMVHAEELDDAALDFLAQEFITFTLSNSAAAAAVAPKENGYHADHPQAEGGLSLHDKIESNGPSALSALALAVPASAQAKSAGAVSSPLAIHSTSWSVPHTPDRKWIDFSPSLSPPVVDLGIVPPLEAQPCAQNAQIVDIGTGAGGPIGKQGDPEVVPSYTQSN